LRGKAIEVRGEAAEERGGIGMVRRGLRFGENDRDEESDDEDGIRADDAAMDWHGGMIAPLPAESNLLSRLASSPARVEFE